MRFIGSLILLAILPVASAFSPKINHSNRAFFPLNQRIGGRNVQQSMAAIDTDPKNIKVGVIGCGRIGLVHLEAITKAPNVTPVIISNPTVSKAEAGKRYL